MSIRLKGFLAALMVSGICASATLMASEVAPEELELFSAMEQGKIEVKVVAKNAMNARLDVTNKTPEPLKINLPDSFALVPVLAQDFSGGSGRSGSRGSSSSSSRSGSGGGSQSSGGSSSSGRSGSSSSRSGGSSFSLLPEKTIQDHIKTVCLEHGKKDPSPRVRYEIRPITDVTDNKAVHLLCEKVGLGEVDQNSAQAAVWHLNNEMSWEELAAKFDKDTVGRKFSYFSSDEMEDAMRLASKAVKTIEEQERAIEGAKAGPSLADNY